MKVLFDICCGNEKEEHKPDLFSDNTKVGNYNSLEIGGTIREKGEVALELKRGGTLFNPGVDLRASLKFIPKVYAKSKYEDVFLNKAVRSHLLFQDLSNKEIQMIVDATEKQTISKGTKIIEQNSEAHFLQIIQEGEVKIYCESLKHSFGTLFSGDIFGETAMLYGERASKSLVAIKPTVLWRIDNESFRNIMAQSAHSRDIDIRSCLSKIPLFKSIGDQHLHKFASALTRVKFKKGERIVNKGEVGTVFYLIEEGIVKVHDIGIGDSCAVGQLLKAGDSFGERSLLTGEPRAANITAETSVLTLAMNRNNFHKYMGDLQAMMDFEAKLQSLKSLPIFAMSDLTQLELERLAEQTIEVSYREGTKLTELGSSTENLWMIRSGKLLLYGGESGKVYNLEAGDTFGEQYILHDDEFIRTHYAVCEQNLTTWVLNRDQIESIIVDISRLGEEAGHLEGNKMATVKRRDIKMFRVLGEGAFGKVWLATNIFTNVPYAVKVIKKQRVLLMKQEKNVLREKDFLASLQHPFILGMVSSFQDPSDLYIVMPLVQGGELFSIVSSRLAKAETLSNIEAAFYLGCVAEALGHFHHRYIAYRDLKLENIMIDSDGYVKVVDLGFAKMVPDKTFTFCGTPDYLAPEIIMSKGHNHTVDYWSLGVLMYTLLSGNFPFHQAESTQMDLFKRIVLVQYEMPPTVHFVAADLIQKLLCRNVPDRLGNLKRGHFDIHDHKWFGMNGISYKKLLKREMIAPWIPKLKDPFDVSNFDEYNYSRSERHLPLSSAQQALFAGF